ncbi:ParB N-terminal domain-containing protein [Calothrix sp. UHCC 0171]|uniref:ParB N-terminal domain-containing protein n=1 Tax=Calothrix sp. UHCC 0171 TaxID=3110245 RepID=UPI002B205B2A|nr:ParB N-terminal domain-containing protein [Calothrix sp. UHCC 0171]MEA5572930.1 ParB N-terminal domain-containing protein [Calothrix sp. UHCC 0171]
MPTVLAVFIDRINIGSNRRPIKDDKVVELMQSIRANGLLNPITVDRKFNLIAGLHRLTACRLLGFDQIECKIVNYEDADQARLAEIDENFIRNELEPLERYELWLERDRILGRMGLRFKPGDNQHTAKISITGGEINSPPPKTTLELAKGFGYSERSFQQGKQIARDIHPDVKQKIIGTSLSKSRTIQLKIARIGNFERTQAETAEKAFEAAMQKGDKVEAEYQASLAKQAREKQKELQLQAFQSAISQDKPRNSYPKKITKPIPKKEALISEPIKNGKPIVAKNQTGVEPGEKWMLNKHLVYCGNTAGKQFINLLPSDAALAIATLSSFWEHDYLINEARVVAVLRSPGHVNNFCSSHQMPFQYEFILNNIYVSIFSHHPIPKPENIINVEGIEGIISYLLNMYSHPNSFVISPFMGHGEILIACDRLGRTCFIGDENPELIHRGIQRWQSLTSKQARKII